MKDKVDLKIKDMVLRNPGNSWNWYEIAKDIEATDISQLIVIAQNLGLFSSNREAIIDGYGEYRDSKRMEGSEMDKELKEEESLTKPPMRFPSTNPY